MKTNKQKGVNNMTKINDESSLPKLFKDSKSDMLSTLYVYELEESSKELQMLNDLKHYLIKTHNNKTKLYNDIRREFLSESVKKEEAKLLGKTCLKKSPLHKRYEELSKELYMLLDYIFFVGKIYDNKRKLFNELPNKFNLSLTKKGETNE